MVINNYIERGAIICQSPERRSRKGNNNTARVEDRDGHYFIRGSSKVRTWTCCHMMIVAPQRLGQLALAYLGLEWLLFVSLRVIRHMSYGQNQLVSM